MKGASTDPSAPSAAYQGRIRLRVGALVHRRVSCDGMEGTELLVVKVHVPTRPEPIWMVPGGGVEPGETLEQALARELWEETGFVSAAAADDSPPMPAAIHEFIEPPFHALEIYFTVRGADDRMGLPEPPPSGDAIRPTGDLQVIDIRWVRLENLRSLRLEPSFLADPSFHLSLAGEGAPVLRIRRNGV